MPGKIVSTPFLSQLEDMDIYIERYQSMKADSKNDNYIYQQHTKHGDGNMNRVNSYRNKYYNNYNGHGSMDNNHFPGKRMNAMGKFTNGDFNDENNGINASRKRIFSNQQNYNNKYLTKQHNNQYNGANNGISGMNNGLGLNENKMDDFQMPRNGLVNSQLNQSFASSQYSANSSTASLSTMNSAMFANNESSALNLGSNMLMGTPLSKATPASSSIANNAFDYMYLTANDNNNQTPSSGFTSNTYTNYLNNSVLADSNGSSPASGTPMNNVSSKLDLTGNLYQAPFSKTDNNASSSSFGQGSPLNLESLSLNDKPFGGIGINGNNASSSALVGNAEISPSVTPNTNSLMLSFDSAIWGANDATVTSSNAGNSIGIWNNDMSVWS